MLCAKALVLLGALLSGPLDPAGEYQTGLSLASGCHSVPLGMREGKIAVKHLPESWSTGQIAAPLSGLGKFPAQTRLRAGIATWVGLGALREPEKHGRRPRVFEVSRGG